MKRTMWLERKFNFDFPAGLMENIIARLSGTTSRLNDLILPLPNELLIFKLDQKWSIKEQIGHLAATEMLHEGRIDDFIARKEVLRPALFRKPDNEPADYNEEDVRDILSRFDNNRKSFILRLEELDDDIQLTSILHPRLQVKMRPVDVAYFTAEHDDHHIAGIREIISNYFRTTNFRTEV